MIELVEKLEKNRSLSKEEYTLLIENRSESLFEALRKKADEKRRRIYGNEIYIRGLIEVSSFCKNDCLYCGIRKSNKNCQRYRLTEEEILLCCEEGYNLGFRTFVLQGGEDAYFSDEKLISILRTIKKRYPDTAVSLSLGERSKESYKRLFDAGADRYLLREETFSKEHYELLHKNMSFEKRIECLKNLKEIGFETGCGFMVGSPFQKSTHIAEDLKFIEEFSPEMCGIGPFISHKDTPFKNEKNGDAFLCCYLLSIIRLIKPNILLPSTTALGTIEENGREMGILSGANVIMPNLSPKEVRKKYMLYDGKISEGEESAQNLKSLKEKMKKIGFEIVTDKGSIKPIPRKEEII